MDYFGVFFGIAINAVLLSVLFFAAEDTLRRYFEYFRGLFREKKTEDKGDVIKVEYGSVDWQTCA